MYCSLLLNLFASPLLLTANHLPRDNKLSRRDPCDGINATPVLYHEYREDICPPKYSIASDGSCPYTNHLENDCAAFYQVRTNFVYGTEQPFVNTFCHGPETCAISQTYTRTVALSGSITPKF